MKIRAIKTVAMILIIATAMAAMLSVSAGMYDGKILHSKFNDSSGFLPAGDIDLNGTVGTEDEAKLKKHLLEIESLTGINASVADVNGDGQPIDICDLVRLKKNFGNEAVKNGALVVKGNTVYNSAFETNVIKGKTYKIEFTYKGSASVIKLLGKEISVDKCDTETLITKTVTFDNTYSGNIKLQIIGNDATVKNLSISRNDSIDNEISAGSINKK